MQINKLSQYILKKLNALMLDKPLPPDTPLQLLIDGR